MNAAFNERLKLRIGPGPLVVTPGGIEHAALSVFTHPWIRFGIGAVAPFSQHEAIRVVPGMSVSFVPTLDRRVALHYRMVGGDDGFLEHAGSMFFELRPDQFYVLRRVKKAERSAMDRREPAAFFDEIQETL